MSPSTAFIFQGSMIYILGIDKSSIRSINAHEQIDGDGNVHTFMKEAESVVDMVQMFDYLYLYTDVVESSYRC